MADGDLLHDCSIVAGAQCSALEAHPWDSASQAQSEGEGSEAGKKQKGKGKSSKAKAAAKNQAKGQARTKKPQMSPKSDMQVCELCDEAKPITDFDLAAYKCKDCKKDLDSLSRMAARQGHKAWYNETMKGPLPKRKKVLKEFRQRYRVETCSDKKKAFQMLTLVEKFTVEVADDTIVKGKMMWEDEAVEFWQSTKGGKMSQVEAKQKWQDALQNEKEFPQDQLGPKQAPTRVRVPKGDYVNFRTTAGRTKEMNVATQKRKYDEDDVKRAQRQCLSGFDTVCGVDSSTMDSVARQLFKDSDLIGATGATNASMHSHGAIEVNLKSLRSGPNAEGIKEEGEGEETSSSKAASKASGHRSKIDDHEESEDHYDWFDAKTTVSKLVRGVRITNEALQKSLQAALAGITACLATPIANEDVENYRISKELCEDRRVPVQAVLSADAKELESYLSDVFNSKKAPACSGITKLCRISTLKELEKEMEKCATKDEIDKLAASHAAKKKTIQQLVKAAEAAVKDFSSVTKSIQKQKDEELKAAAKNEGQRAYAGRPRKVAGEPIGIMEVSSGVAKEFVSVAENGAALQAADKALPFQVSSSEASKSLYKPTHPIHSESQNRFIKAKSQNLRTSARL